ncbi:mono/diheme cytochrome c family protein [Sphingomonas sp. BE270]|jgi:mono/diheme cytochrome c family protein|nr:MULTISPECIES: cytochrome c [unclassified Sphingomonas]MDR6847714.1 mono/diheme cytochrome c family protein [Sphingomonas sp. BE137]MDR7257744.1 mono/diheme cytochrome c family protein [Sphingomonas sp. BE270]
MTLRSFGTLLGVGALALSAGTAIAAQSPRLIPGIQRWAEIDRIPRHHFVATKGVPEPYRALRNPLPATDTTIARGAVVYAANCLSCHGQAGKGDGAAGRGSTPSPFDIAWLSEMKISRIDGFMYWSIAEGGRPFSSAMPAFDTSLTKDEIWAVTRFIQAGLPCAQGASRAESGRCAR